MRTECGTILAAAVVVAYANTTLADAKTLHELGEFPVDAMEEHVT